jgi:hypothetical protein
LKEYLEDQSKPTSEPRPSSEMKIVDGERTYSAFLAKADLNQVAIL